MSTVGDTPEHPAVPVAELLARSGAVVAEGSGGRRRREDPAVAAPAATAPRTGIRWITVVAVLVAIVILAVVAYALYAAFGPDNTSLPAASQVVRLISGSTL